jgi:dTDP-4-dehydrorhamnose 3,5-epimerase
MKWQSFELRPEDRSSLHVPKGCANAFFTLEDNSIIHYYASAAYAPDFERGIRYNDPQFDFEWPCHPVTVSDKDAAWANFDKEINVYK